MIKNLSVAIFLLSFFGNFCFASIPHPYNTKFELGIKGEMPISWSMTQNSEKRGYVAVLTDTEVNNGKFSAEISNYTISDTLPLKEKEGVLKQELDAFAFRGKWVTLTGYIKEQYLSDKSQAGLWVNLFQGTTPLDVYNTEYIPTTQKDSWTKYEIKFYVPLEADKISYGAFSRGQGRIWVDELDFKLVHSGFEAINRETNLSELQKHYLTIFAKLFGYMRYYSSQSKIESIDWDNILLHGVNASLKAKNDIDFLAQINPLCKYTLPGISFAKNKDGLKSYTKPKGALEDVVMAMIHSGLPELKQDDNFVSSNINIMNSQRKSHGTAMQIVSLSDFKAGKMEVSFDASLDSKITGSRGELWIKIDGQNGKPLAKLIADNIRITDKKLKRYTTQFDFPDGTQTITLAFTLNGDGKATFDNIKSKIVTQGVELPFKLFNPEFDILDSDGSPAKWLIPEHSRLAGYNIYVEKSKSNNYLVISSDESQSLPFPAPGESLALALQDTLWANVPLCFYSDGYKLLPESILPSLTTGRDSSFVYLEEDLNSRLSIAINLWNAIRFFEKSSDDSLKNKLLNTLFDKVAVANNRDSFQQALSEAVYSLNVPGVSIWKGEDELVQYLPFLAEYYNNQVIITKTLDSASNINPGDRILKINNIPINELVEDKLKTLNPADNIETRYAKAVNMIFTDKYRDKSVSLELMRPDESVYSVTVEQNMLLGELKYFVPERIALVDSSVVYIDACAVDDKELAKLIDGLKDYSGIILDLRGNALVSEHFLSFFLKDTVKCYSGESFTYYHAAKLPKRDTLGGNLVPSDIAFRAKLALLIDEKTSGFSEAILKTASNGKIAKSFGKLTSGNSSIMDIVNLAGNYYISMPALNLLFDGETISGQQKPDVIVDDNPIYKALDRDIILEEALKYLQSEISK